MTLSQIRTQYHLVLKKISDIANRAQIDTRSFEGHLDSSEKRTFDLAFTGEFTAGKSSIINAILGREILPTRLEPTTARITYLAYDTDERIELKMVDGRIERHPFSESNLQQLIASNPGKVADVKEIYVFLEHPLLRNSIRFIDTPGTNDSDEQRVEVTYNLLPSADGVVYVTIYPVTESNLTVYNEHIRKNNLHNVIFVLNKIDLYSQGLDRIISDARYQFEKVHGEQIEFFYSVSAIDYIEGLAEKDDEMVAKSLFAPFLNDLTAFIDGSAKLDALRLQHTETTKALKKEVQSLIELKIAGMSLSEEDFNKGKIQLEKDLDEKKQLARELSRQMEGEYDRLIIRIEESVAGLRTQLIESVNMLDTAQGDIDSILKQIEFSVNNLYTSWKSHNEPLINSFLQTIQKELSVRLSAIQESLSLNLTSFSGNALVVRNKHEQGSVMDLMLKDDTKAHFASTALTVGGMFVLSTLSIFPPIAFLLGPLFMQFRKKKIAEQKQAMKPQVIESIQTGFSAFSTDVMRNINLSSDELQTKISRTINDQAERIKEQMRAIERERLAKREEITMKISGLKSLIDELKGVAE